MKDLTLGLRSWTSELLLSFFAIEQTLPRIMVMGDWPISFRG